MAEFATTLGVSITAAWIIYIAGIAVISIVTTKITVWLYYKGRN